MNKLMQSEAAIAFERFCVNRKLNKEKVATVYEFAAFIDYGLGTIRRNMKDPNAIEVPVSDHTKHQINLLNSDHGELLLKAMIVKRYTGHKWILLKAKKHYYLCTSWFFSMYYDLKDSIRNILAYF